VCAEIKIEESLVRWKSCWVEELWLFNC